MPRISSVTSNPSLRAGAMAAENADAPTGGLHDCLKKKLMLSEAVQAILHKARERGDASTESECRQLLSRLASDRFNLVVVGHFNRGKSTLMNAILGMDYLPTGILPLTSVITSVGYGGRECVLLHKDSGGIPFEIPLSQLAEWVTEQGNPGNRKRVKAAEIRLPVELLRLGFHFVDTPGVGSAIAENTRTTRAFLPEIDAALFVTSFDSPLDERELELLTDVLAHTRQVFIVINKADLVSAEDMAAVTSFVRGRLAQEFPTKAPSVFGVSALRALRCKMDGDARGLADSGLPQLGRALAGFLRVGKNKEFLLRSVDRAQELLSKLEALDGLSDKTAIPEEKRTDLIVQIRRHAEALHQELEIIMDQAGTQSAGAARAYLERALSSWTPQLSRTLLELAQEWLSRATFGELMEAGTALAERVSDRCRERLTGWLTDRHQSLVEALQGELERTGARMARACENASTIAIDSGAALHLNVPYTPINWAAEIDYAFTTPALPSLAWKPAWTVLFWDVPLGFARRAILKRLSGGLSEAVALYLDAVPGVFGQITAMRVKRATGSLMYNVEEEAGRLVRALQGETSVGSAAGLADVRCRLTDLRAEVEATPSEGPEVPESTPVDTSAPGNCGDSQAIGADCVICEKVVNTLYNYMREKQYSLSVNARDKGQHAAVSGFCSVHGWYYETLASPQGICQAYPPVLELAAARLRALAGSAASLQSMAGGVADLLPAPAKCPACQVVNATARACAKEVITRLDAAAALPPLCLVHLRTVLNAKPSDEQSRRLLAAEASAFDRIAEDMRTYALKHSAVRHELMTHREQWVHRSALLKLSGHHNCGMN